jgi:hypothetical protein
MMRASCRIIAVGSTPIHKVNQGAASSTPLLEVGKAGEKEGLRLTY